MVAAVATARVAEETDQETTVKASAVENGQAVAWGAGVERKGVVTVGTVEQKAEALKDVERRRRHPTRDIAILAKIGLTRMLEKYRMNRGVQEA